MPDFKLNDRDMIEGIFGFGSHVFFFSLSICHQRLFLSTIKWK